jgi:hypothetical protein
VVAKDMINSLTAVVTVRARHEKRRLLMKSEGQEGEGIALFGKHYLVRSEGVSRQYTIARVMERGTYTRFVKAL